MDIETETSWYIYGNQSMAARTILKAVSVWRLISNILAHPVYMALNDRLSK